jgi:hypothetical protein
MAHTDMAALLPSPHMHPLPRQHASRQPSPPETPCLGTDPTAPPHTHPTPPPGKCKVEETPKGWFITLIRRDTLEELDKEARVKRERAEMEEEERSAVAIRQQVGGRPCCAGWQWLAVAGSGWQWLAGSAWRCP